MPPIPSFQTVCTAKRVVAPGVFELRFTKPEGFAFRAGQYVMFDVPTVHDPNDVQVRAYSVASAPGESDLLFVIKLVANGRASAWVERVLQVGSSVTMRGPLGVLRFDAGSKPIVCVATGTGVAPFRSMIIEALGEESARTIDLYFGVRSGADVFWADEWRALESRHPRLRVHLSAMDGTPNWHGESGALQDMIRGRIAGGEVSVYLCGAPDIVKTLQEVCLHEWRIPKGDIHSESFI